MTERAPQQHSRYPREPRSICIIGGGLAGSEAALQLAKRGHAVTLYDMKPVKRSPAHHSNDYAEIVCSNSLGNLQTSTASGLLKAEMRALGCELLAIAESVAVPAGNALAVDRERFAAAVTAKIQAEPLITTIGQDVETIPRVPDDADYVLIATGPLTSEKLSKSLQDLLEAQHLAFFDAAAPIVTRDSINFDIAFVQDRYSDADEADGAYINCPLNKDEYTRLIDFILSAEKAPPKEFELTDNNPRQVSHEGDSRSVTNDKKKTCFFESCLPIEELARRGLDTPRFGPMKPVGLLDPRDGKRPHAVIQLRQDNSSGTLYNIVGFQTSLKWGEQKTMISLIPGLENAEIVRYGVMHRNTFVNSPEVLQPTLELRKHPSIQLAGQITGVEGYTECIATGLIAAMVLDQKISDETPNIPSAETMLGSLLRYITRDGVKNFQPINSNWGILPPLPVKAGEKPLRDKKLRNEHFAERALNAIERFNKEPARFI